MERVYCIVEGITLQWDGVKFRDVLVSDILKPTDILQNVNHLNIEI